MRAGLCKRCAADELQGPTLHVSGQARVSHQHEMHRNILELKRRKSVSHIWEDMVNKASEGVWAAVSDPRWSVQVMCC